MSDEAAERAYMLALGTRLRVLRRRRRWTQEQFAAAAGMTRNFVSAAERGRHQFSVVRLAYLAAALGVSSADLLADERVPPLPPLRP